MEDTQNNSRAYHREKPKREDERTRDLCNRYQFKRDPFTLRTLRLMATLGTAAFAYILWNIDVHFCPMLTRWKRELGMPFGILLELHGWWHVLTAVAAYSFMGQSCVQDLLPDNHDRLSEAPIHYLLTHA